ncbi:MAG: class I SAM-dependent methyltransferase [Xanthobacteraceae bacterium]|nr:class I SAM-dependent methyltransferase [Xanthobacteraceae bacterium]
MTLRDIGLWIRSARADATIRRKSRAYGVARAFDELYRDDQDPYGAADRRYRYQDRKYAMLLSFLPARRYRHVLELGCGVGAFSRALAIHAERVTGIDISANAIQHATALSRKYLNLSFRAGDVHTFDPDGRQYDLIVAADVLYYAVPSAQEPALAAVANRLAACLAPGGMVLLADHYFFGLDAASRITQAIHDTFPQAAGLQIQSRHFRCFYLATLLQRANGHAAPDGEKPGGR